MQKAVAWFLISLATLYSAVLLGLNVSLGLFPHLNPELHLTEFRLMFDKVTRKH